MGRGLPPLSLPKALVIRVDQEAGDLLTVVMVWVEVSQAEEERRELSALSDAPTGDHETLLGAGLLKSAWN